MEELYSAEAKKISISEDTLNCMNAENFLKFWKLQNEYIASIEAKISHSDPKKAALLDKLKKLSELQAEIEVNKKVEESNKMDFSNYPVDPMVHESIKTLNEDLSAEKRLQKVLETDLQNCSYSAENQVGKLLISKCRQLSQENKELKDEINQGILPQAEAEVCLQKQQKAQLLAEYQDYSDLSIELEHELKEKQCKLSEVQACYKTLFREEAAVISAAAEAAATSSASNSTKTNYNSHYKSTSASHKFKSAKYDEQN